MPSMVWFDFDIRGYMRRENTDIFQELDFMRVLDSSMMLFRGAHYVTDFNG